MSVDKKIVSHLISLTEISNQSLLTSWLLLVDDLLPANDKLAQAVLDNLELPAGLPETTLHEIAKGKAIYIKHRQSRS
jgi:hypothetical protein